MKREVSVYINVPKENANITIDYDFNPKNYKNNG